MNSVNEEEDIVSIRSAILIFGSCESFLGRGPCQCGGTNLYIRETFNRDLSKVGISAQVSIVLERYVSGAEITNGGQQMFLSANQNSV